MFDVKRLRNARRCEAEGRIRSGAQLPHRRATSRSSALPRTYAAERLTSDHARGSSRPVRLPINVGYRVGGKDDPPGRSGFAHLFEHLMFKGTKQHAPRDDRPAHRRHRRHQQRVHRRRHHQLLRSRSVELSRDAAVGRSRPACGSLTVTEANFHTERDVVIGEYDQRILAEPYGMLDELGQSRSVRRASVRRGVIGDPENLRAATLDDVRRVSPHVLPARQRGAGRRRRFRSGAANDRGSTSISADPASEAAIPRVTTVEPAR